MAKFEHALPWVPESGSGASLAPKVLTALKAALACGYWIDPVLGIVYSKQGKALKPFGNGVGYDCVSLCGARVPIHKAVAYCVWGDRAFGGRHVHVRHLDGDASNNTMTNLAIGTPHENALDKPATLRERVGRASWTALSPERRQARAMLAGKHSAETRAKKSPEEQAEWARKGWETRRRNANG
jgi:hypothetical protein